MEFIKLFIVGSIGYFLSGLYDVAILYDKSILKRILFLGFFITGVPYIFLPFLVTSPLPPIVLLLFVPLILLFLWLLLYSVFFETQKNNNGTSSQLYQKGTYGFSRHPGFLWYTAINCLIAIYFWDFRVALLCLGFTLCNFILIFIEDVLLFPRIFLEYREYKKQVPFLLSFNFFLHWRRPR